MASFTRSLSMLQALRAKDRSAFILSQYIPKQSQNAFVGLRTFNLETIKVVDTASEPTLSKLKLEFWKSSIQKMFNANAPAQDLKEPVCALIHKSVFEDQQNLHKKYLLTMVQTQQDRLRQQPLRTIEDMERYGEGVYSQMNYAMLDILQSPSTRDYLAANSDLDELVTNACAHIGQANGIAALLRGFHFYARKHNYLNLPLRSLQSASLSEQVVLDAADKGALKEVSGLQDVVFEVATRANDHILTAKSLMEQFKQETGAKLPYSFVLPAMSAVPVQLYLEHLEGSDFDLSKAVSGEWKLPYRTWRVYSKRAL